MLTEIELKDFKSFAALPDGGEQRGGVAPLTLLVGANASGKSDFLDALQFLQGLSLDLSVAEVLGGRPSGVDHALDQKTVTAIVEDNRGMVDLFLLLVDRDCDRCGNVERARQREREHERHVLACLAVEEVEVWMLALHAAKVEAAWADVRAECDPRERFAELSQRVTAWLAVRD